ncbi:SGNH/GDSL hydrolase family protein [Kordiimonas pumila]|uniref:SGNH/GDSL hydrolase family protein n=1 Tax=Kordiimonas pumila TaxID=2161677 RepID=A0ABV7D1D6_9PROT|nr:GDSL-type esterase/lipase family protein [Kordiimonas pumila]
MKKLYKVGIALFILLALARLFVSASKEVERDGAGYHKTTTAHYNRLDGNIEPGAILFIGSSSVAGMNVSDITNRAVNLGIGGEKSDQTLARMQAYQSVDQAAAVFLAIGFNDLKAGRDAGAVAATIHQILELIPEGIPLVLSSVQVLLQKSAGLPEPEAFNHKVRALNSTLAAMCEKRGLCTFVDINRLGCVEGVVAKDLRENDGIHLNFAGYNCFKNILKTIFYELNLK